jgi:MYXO-CTERM domain-containing protein
MHALTSRKLQVTLTKTALSALVALGATAFATESRADCADARCSKGTTAMKYESSKGLGTNIETPWMPATGNVQVKAFIAVDPVKDGGPMYTVDMPKGAVVETSWVRGGKATLKLVTGEAGGMVKARHTLTPTVQLKVSLFGLKQTFNFEATDLVSKIPGSKFNYDAKNETAFSPWGFEGGKNVVEGPKLSEARLFSVGFESFGETISQYIGGTLALSARTAPTFAYKTTQVVLAGADKPVTAQGDEMTVTLPDADYYDVNARVDGELTVSGNLEAVPNVNITRVYSIGGLDVTLPVGVGAKTDYATPAEKISFPSQTVHIPLPNVKVPSQALAMGDTKAGSRTEKTVTVQNTGEMAAEMEFKSENAAFQVPSGKVVVPPKSSFELKVAFVPGATGPASGDVIVTSNDPDSPEQKISISANGTAGTTASGDSSEEDDAAGEKTSGGAPAADSGCGCKTTNTSASGMGGSALLFGLALLAIRRRKHGA